MRLEGVWLRYHRRGPWVLRETEVRIGPGEVAVVLGRNGVGKSTLLQLAAGVLRPTRGRVVDRPGVVGWVPERFPADQPFTVEAYLTAMGRVTGLSGPAAERAVRHWVDRLGLARFHGVRLPQLSKGTAQKVGLAQALLRPPGLLVLDEPWEGLDAAAREIVPEVVGEVLADGGTVLVSDHRGETVRLPGARHWTVADGTVTEESPAGEPAVAVVELAVPAAGVAAAVARLRAEGHHVLRVRDHAAPPPATRPDPALRADPLGAPRPDSGSPGEPAEDRDGVPTASGPRPAEPVPAAPDGGQRGPAEAVAAAPDGRQRGPGLAEAVPAAPDGDQRGPGLAEAVPAAPDGGQRGPGPAEAVPDGDQRGPGLAEAALAGPDGGTAAASDRTEPAPEVAR